MTQREKVLATGLLSALAVLGAAAVFHLFVYQPISEIRGQIDEAREQLTKKQGELQTEEKQIDAVLRVNPRLKQWQKLSLPPRDPELKKSGLSIEEQKRRHAAQLQVEYERYLSELMRRSGFQRESVVITPRSPDRRGAGTGSKAKEQPYERLAFGVTGRGSMDSLAKALKEFHTTTLLHQVRSVNVSMAQPRGRTMLKPGTVDVNLSVEALLVQGAEERTGMIPSKLKDQPRVLAEPSRDYTLLDKRNMFTGIEPPRRTVRQAEERNDVLRWVKLTMIAFNPERSRWEATLYDQAKGGNEKKLNTRILNELTILDKDKNTVFEGKVVHIDESQMIIEADGKHFRMRCGDMMYPAIREEMSKKDLSALGLAPPK